jgi:hypothetical protein
MMDMRESKVGQKVHIQMDSQVYECTVVETNGPTFGWGHTLAEEYVRVEPAPSVSKWPPRDLKQNTKLKLVDGKWEKLEWVPTPKGGFWKPVPLLADDLAAHSRTENDPGFAIDFNYDGSYICSWGGVDDWEPRCLGVGLKILVEPTKWRECPHWGCPYCNQG